MKHLVKFLNKNKGVIHVGANGAEEAPAYESHNLDVIWIEPILERFKVCVKKLKSNFPKQRIINYLVSDQDHQLHDFYIADNNGASSSILEPAEHKITHPHILFSNVIKMKSLSLDSIIKTEGVDKNHYTNLVMDTQGSELLILKGAINYLDTCETIILEAANFEAYKGCPKVIDFDFFLSKHGFKKTKESCFNAWEGDRKYYDILYMR